MHRTMANNSIMTSSKAWPSFMASINGKAVQYIISPPRAKMSMHDRIVLIFSIDTLYHVPHGTY